MNENVILVKRKEILFTSGPLKGTTLYLDEYRVSAPEHIASIDTTKLSTGSNILVANGTADFHQWNGTAWIKAD